ncbi:MAG: hypothetical protein Q8L23_11340 [Caulobacter sp.]|nr:hypothetical protein [Caulobacter sp.]
MNDEDNIGETHTAGEDGGRKPWHPPLIEVFDTRAAENTVNSGPDSSSSS